MFGNRSCASGKSEVESSTIAVFSGQVHAADSPRSVSRTGSPPRALRSGGLSRRIPRRRRRGRPPAPRRRGLRGEADDRGARRAGAHGGGRMRAVEARQPEVHQDDVRVEAFGRAAASPVGDRPDDLDPRPSGEEQLERRCGTPRCPPRAARGSGSFGRQEQWVVRLAAGMDLDLDARVAPLELVDELLQGRLVGAREQRQELAAAVEQTLRDRPAISSKLSPLATAVPSTRPSHAPLRTSTPSRTTSREATVTSPVATLSTASPSSARSRPRDARRRRRSSRRARPAPTASARRGAACSRAPPPAPR